MSYKKCRECGDRLFRVEVVDVKTNDHMGHYWKCDPCDVGYVGFGDPDEYDGKPKTVPATDTAKERT